LVLYLMSWKMFSQIEQFRGAICCETNCVIRSLIVFLVVFSEPQMYLKLIEIK
jgi:hypothetical protein